MCTNTHMHMGTHPEKVIIVQEGVVLVINYVNAGSDSQTSNDQGLEGAYKML